MPTTYGNGDVIGKHSRLKICSLKHSVWVRVPSPAPANTHILPMTRECINRLPKDMAEVLLDFEKRRKPT